MEYYGWKGARVEMCKSYAHRYKDRLPGTFTLLHLSTFSLCPLSNLFPVLKFPLGAIFLYQNIIEVVRAFEEVFEEFHSGAEVEVTVINEQGKYNISALDAESKPFHLIVLPE